DGVSTRFDFFAFITNAPFLINPIAAQSVDAAMSWTFTVPNNTFADLDTPVLTYSATLGDGSPLPSWLTFNASTATFTGTPPSDWSGQTSLTVTASDGSHSASDTF